MNEQPIELVRKKQQRSKRSVASGVLSLLHIRRAEYYTKQSNLLDNAINGCDVSEPKIDLIIIKKKKR